MSWFTLCGANIEARSISNAHDDMTIDDTLVSARAFALLY